MGVQINLRKQHPIQNAERILFCQSLKEIGADKISKLEDRHHAFILTIDEEDGSKSYEIDWEFTLFEATSFQMNCLLECFVQVPKEGASKIIQS